MGSRVIKRTVPTNCPILQYGRQVGCQIAFDEVVTDVPAYSAWVPSNSGAGYVPLAPIAVVASVSSNTYTMDSAAQASGFDPTSLSVNDYWKLTGSGAQTVTFYDESTGLMAAETEVVSSVSTTDVVTVAAFSTPPEADDIFLPGGCVNADVDNEIVIIPRSISVAEMEMEQSDINVIGYAEGTILSSNNMTAGLSALVTAGIIGTYGVDTQKIVIDTER